MFFKTIPKILLEERKILLRQLNRKCHNVFGFKELIQPEKTNNFTIHQVASSQHEMAVDIVKKHYLSEHVFVRTRRMELNDRALDEYLMNLLKQGNAVYATTDDGKLAGVCVNFASCPADPKNLRHYAYYRQDANVKDFLRFTATLQETPSLWNTFKQTKVFEIKMLTVLPEYRRQGLAVALVEKSQEQALDQGYKVIRMDCINLHDYKIAERCKMQCIFKFPLHKLRDPHAPFIKRSSELNTIIRVYVSVREGPGVLDRNAIKERQQDLENLME